ncbi:Cell growth-regulating nucleolar protein [Coniochaeta hoffmannii]|uniref:Cell growth-regulating nucleolar protein n=1 Tax=Coniochaeta hoffmannii TaxID=91930 RepID=A0AA38RXV1_9PEZI|nr:Cell growth-regulating nucleolar protein [Coniochaeta hoffmannii]
MVSFSCEGCGDVLTKKKLDPHRTRCRGATFTCIDCMVHFPGTEYRAHTSCMTEAQKYQGSTYKNKRAKTSATDTPSAPKAMAHVAYVEDVPEEYGQWRDYQLASDEDNMSPAEPLPEAPTPPSQDDGPLNVFDFLVNATPTASNLSLPGGAPVKLSEDTQLVRFDYENNQSLDDLDAMVEYGTGPVPVSHFETPAPKGEKKKSKDGDKELKKDKKRKRLHLDIQDQVMTDAPVLHSGLTGGLNRLMARESSPGGGRVTETPASPLKKSKQHKHRGRTETSLGNSLMAMIASGSSKTKTKTKKRKHTSSTSPKQSRQRLEAPKETKLLEYRPGSKDSTSKDAKDGHAMVLYKPRAEQFLGFVNKGPESERGCSLNKVLKRYHRERSETGNNTLSKVMEEKELWKSLRLKKNDRGEIVLFAI